MKGSIEKKSEEKNQSPSLTRVNNNASTFTDSRSQFVAQKKLQNMMNNSSQSRGPLSGSAVAGKINAQSNRQPIQRVEINTPGGIVETDNLTDQELEIYCRQLNVLAQSTPVKNQWEGEYHKAAAELLKRSISAEESEGGNIQNDVEMNMGDDVQVDEVKALPQSFNSIGHQFNLVPKFGEFLIYDNGIKSNKKDSVHVTIHQPIMDMRGWDKDNHEISVRYYISKRASLGVTLLAGNIIAATGAIQNAAELQKAKQVASDFYAILNASK